MKRVISWVMVFCLILTLPVGAGQGYLQKNVVSPGFAEIGGEWTVMALNEAGDTGKNKVYLNNLEKTLKETKGVLSKRKYTDYARVCLTLCAMGENPKNIDGYDVLSPLMDTEMVLRQGVTGAAYALMALDAAGSADAVKHTYITYLLEKQLPDGGFALSGNTANADVTAMVLQALAPYGKGERGLEALSQLQLETGGFASYGQETAESSAQVLLALLAWDIHPESDAFMKNGNSVLTALAGFARADGGYAHIKEEKLANLMATEQVSLALATWQTAQKTLPVRSVIGWYEGVTP